MTGLWKGLLCFSRCPIRVSFLVLPRLDFAPGRALLMAWPRARPARVQLVLPRPELPVRAKPALLASRRTLEQVQGWKLLPQTQVQAQAENFPEYRLAYLGHLR